VVFYGVRGKDNVLFEILDDDLKVVGTLSMQDFITALEGQKKNLSNTKPSSER
jgi:hypothetical protein